MMNRKTRYENNGLRLNYCLEVGLNPGTASSALNLIPTLTKVNFFKFILEQLLYDYVLATSCLTELFVLDIAKNDNRYKYMCCFSTYLNYLNFKMLKHHIMDSS